MIISALLGFLSLFFDVVSWAKWIASFLALKWERAKVKRRFDLYDFDNGVGCEQLAIVPPKIEKTLESPFPDSHLTESYDEIFFYGVNSQSERLVIRIARGCNQTAEAWLYLVLKDGRRFRLQDTSGFQRTYGDKVTAFSCGGLQAQYLSAMRRWRIHFCGMLREVTSNDESEHRQVFVKFVLLWTASSNLYDTTSDLDIKATANAMAGAKWDTPYPPIKRLHSALNMYCQTGVIVGTVSVQNETNYEVYLYGERIRYVGKFSDLKGSKFKHLVGNTPKNGLTFHLGKASILNTVENLYFGFVVTPSGRLQKVEDVLIITKLNERNLGTENVAASFKADESYELRGNLITSEIVSFPAEQLWQGRFESHFIEFEVGGFKGSGILMTGEVFDVGTENNVARLPCQIPSVVPAAVSFSDKISQFPDISGGKGASLGKLTELSLQIKTFTVPKGIVVTTAAYKAFLTPELLKKIEKMTNIVYGNTSGDTKEACKVVSSAIENSPLPDNIEKEIEQKLNAVFGSKINYFKFAVRSSATGEDTDQMSAAGQMETFLGVRGLKEVFAAVRKCWASQFGTIAVEYKRQNGQLLNSPMAVVIQEMVDCEAAGVLFTCDPVTSDPSVIAVTANYGLGESVVSGSEEPDTIILDKSDKGTLTIRSVMVGSKHHKIVTQELSESGSTAVIEVPENERNRCCISEETALQLGNLSLKIEDFYKSPRDIEWGILNGRIYILQSRPVTTGAETSDYEIKHEFDAPLRSESEYYTRCNVGEVMPGAASPLGINVVLSYFRVTFACKEMSKGQSNDFGAAVYYTSGTLPFYNSLHMSVVDFLCRTDDMESIMAKSMMIGIFGRILDDPEIKEAVEYKRPKKKSAVGVGETFKCFWKFFFAGRGIKKIQKKVFAFRFPENKNSAKEIFDTQMQFADALKETGIKHMKCTEGSSFWNIQLLSTLAQTKGEIDSDVYSAFAKLLGTMSNVESGDVPNSMQDLAFYIAQEKKSEEFKAMSVEEAQDWLETSTTVAGYKYRQFMKRHGHRGLREFDVRTKTWAKDPKPLIQLLQNMSAHCENIQAKKDSNISEIISSLHVPFDFKTRWSLKFMLMNAQRGVREREFCKSNLVKSVDNIRSGFERLSKAMLAEGFLPDEELIYFMTIEEIRDLLNTRNPKIISRAKHRCKLYPILDNLRFEEISKGRPKPLNETDEEEEIEYDADLTMKGIPVSQGVVKGYARVALTLEEASHLKKGEILITHSTDIGWSPFFPILGGVVTELGGLISHGAVVSREYGLPCVVGLRNATRMFNTGDYVLLDGNKGLLQRIPHPES